MSFEITTAFVQACGNVVFPAAQQRASKLRNLVELEPAVVGKRQSFDKLGTTTARTKDTRHGDTTYGNIAHGRRWANLVSYFDAQLLDKEDAVRVLNDPKSKYALAIAAALGRKIDDLVIDAATGAATDNEEGTSTVAFPAGQQVAAAATGLTYAKILAAKKLLDDADVDEEDRVAVIGPNQLNTDMLNETKITSADYNTVRVSVSGKIETYLGFRWILSTRLKKAGANRSALFYHKSAIGLAIGQDIVPEIDRLPTKHYATQAYASMDMGAVRIEEARIVEVLCQE
jgi:Phage capsid protein